MGKMGIATHDAKATSMQKLKRSFSKGSEIEKDEEPNRKRGAELLVSKASMPFTSTIGIVKGSVFEPLGEEGVQTAELLAAEIAKEIDMLTDHLKDGVDAEMAAVTGVVVPKVVAAPKAPKAVAKPKAVAEVVDEAVDKVVDEAVDDVTPVNISVAAEDHPMHINRLNGFLDKLRSTDVTESDMASFNALMECATQISEKVQKQTAPDAKTIQHNQKIDAKIDKLDQSIADGVPSKSKTYNDFMYNAPRHIKDEHTAVGTTWARKKEIRVLWAQAQKAEIEKTKIYEESFSMTDIKDGEYRTLGAVIVKLGGWSDEHAVAGGKQLFGTCMLLGEEWTFKDPFSGMQMVYQIDHKRREVLMRKWGLFEKAFTDTSTQKPGPAIPPAAVQAGVVGKAAAPTLLPCPPLTGPPDGATRKDPDILPLSFLLKGGAVDSKGMQSPPFGASIEGRDEGKDAVESAAAKGGAEGGDAKGEDWESCIAERGPAAAPRCIARR